MNREQASVVSKIRILEKNLYNKYQLIRFGYIFSFLSLSLILTMGIILSLNFGFLLEDWSGHVILSTLANIFVFGIIYAISSFVVFLMIPSTMYRIKTSVYLKIFWPYKEIILNDNDMVLAEGIREKFNNNSLFLEKGSSMPIQQLITTTRDLMNYFYRLKVQQNSVSQKMKVNSITNIQGCLILVGLLASIVITSIVTYNDAEYGFFKPEPISEEMELNIIEMINLNPSQTLKDKVKHFYALKSSGSSGYISKKEYVEIVKLYNDEMGIIASPTNVILNNELDSELSLKIKTLIKD